MCVKEWSHAQRVVEGRFVQFIFCPLTGGHVYHTTSIPSRVPWPAGFFTSRARDSFWVQSYESLNRHLQLCAMMAALKCVCVCARALVTVKDAYYFTYIYAMTISQYKCWYHHRDHDRVRDFHACDFALTLRRRLRPGGTISMKV